MILVSMKASFPPAESYHGQHASSTNTRMKNPRSPRALLLSATIAVAAVGDPHDALGMKGHLKAEDEN